MTKEEMIAEMQILKESNEKLTKSFAELEVRLKTFETSVKRRLHKMFEDKEAKENKPSIRIRGSGEADHVNRMARGKGAYK